MQFKAIGHSLHSLLVLYQLLWLKGTCVIGFYVYVNHFAVLLLYNYNFLLFIVISSIVAASLSVATLDEAFGAQSPPPSGKASLGETMQTSTSYIPMHVLIIIAM